MVPYQELTLLLRFLPAERLDLKNLLVANQAAISFVSEEDARVLAEKLYNPNTSLNEFETLLASFVTDHQVLSEIAKKLWCNNKLAALVKIAKENQAPIFAAYFSLLQTELVRVENQWQFNKYPIYDFTEEFSGEGAFEECQILIHGKHNTRETLTLLAKIAENESAQNELWNQLLGEARRKYVINKLKEKSEFYSPFAEMLDNAENIKTINQHLSAINIADFSEHFNFLLKDELYENQVRKLCEICGIRTTPQLIKIDEFIAALEQAHVNEKIIDLLRNTTFAAHELIILPTPEEMRQFAQIFTYVNSTDLANVGLHKINKIVPVLARLGFDAEGRMRESETGRLADRILETNILSYLLDKASHKDAPLTKQFLTYLQQTDKTLDAVAAEKIRKCLMGDMENFRYANLWSAIRNLDLPIEVDFDRLVAEWYRLYWHNKLLIEQPHSDVIPILSDAQKTKIIDKNIYQELKDFKQKSGKLANEKKFLEDFRKEIEGKRTRSITRTMVAWSNTNESIEGYIKIINAKLIAMADLILQGKKFNLNYFINIFKTSLDSHTDLPDLNNIPIELNQTTEKQVFTDIKEKLLAVHQHCQQHKNAIELFLVHKRVFLEIVARINNPLAQAIFLKENIPLAKENLTRENLTALEKINKLQFATEGEFQMLFQKVGLEKLDSSLIKQLFKALKQPGLLDIKSQVLQEFLYADPKINLSAGVASELNKQLTAPLLTMQQLNNFIHAQGSNRFLSRADFKLIQLEKLLQQEQIDIHSYKKQADLLEKSLKRFTLLRKKKESLSLDLLKEIAEDFPSDIKQLENFKEQLGRLLELKKIGKALKTEMFKQHLNSDDLFNLLQKNDILRSHKKLIAYIRKAITQYGIALKNHSLHVLAQANKLDRHLDEAYLNNKAVKSAQQTEIAQTLTKLAQLDKLLPSKETIENLIFLFDKQKESDWKKMEDLRNQAEYLSKQLTQQKNRQDTQVDTIELQPMPEKTEDFVKQICNQDYKVKTINFERLALPQTDSLSNSVKFKPHDAHGLEYTLYKDSGAMLYHGNSTHKYTDQKRLCEDMAVRFVATGQTRAPLSGGKELVEKMAICLTALSELLNVKMEITIRESSFKPTLIQRHKIADKKEFFIKNGYIKDGQLLIIGSSLRPT